MILPFSRRVSFSLSPKTTQHSFYAFLPLSHSLFISFSLPNKVFQNPLNVFAMSSRGSFRGRGRGSGSGSNTRFTGKRRGRGGGVAYGIDRAPAANQVARDDGTAATEKFEEVKAYDEIDEKIGFWRFESVRAEGEQKVGWLVNMHQVSCFGGFGRWLSMLYHPVMTVPFVQILTWSMPDPNAERRAPWRFSGCGLLLYSR